MAAVERAIRSERPPHALLLVGPERVGKTTLAFDLARGLLCLAQDASLRPCGECQACRKVDTGNHPDLHLLAPQGAGQQIRVGQIQALSSELALLPLEGRFRVAIVEQAQRLNTDAQNTLLKTLEEPPAGVVLVLAADDSSVLLPTVVSRCVRHRLGPLAPDVVAQLLVDAHSADVSRGVQLARLAGGRPGVALALAQNPEAVVTRARLARTLLSLLEADRRARLAAPAELLEDGASLVRLVEGAFGEAQPAEPADSAAGRGRRLSPAERRAATAQVLAIWREVARDLALAARGGGRELQLRELVEDLSEYGRRVDSAAVGRFLARLESLGRAVEAYANPELALDALLLTWPAATPAPTPARAA